MKRFLLLLCFLPLIAVDQDKNQNFTVSGKTKNLAFKPDWVFLQYRANSECKTDSVQAKNGKYSFSGNIKEPVAGRIRVRYSKCAAIAKIKAAVDAKNRIQYKNLEAPLAIW